jgi:hypothetical protein
LAGIWFNFSRFGVAGLAAVVEQRFEDVEGEVSFVLRVQRPVREVNATISIAFDRRSFEAVWFYRAGYVGALAPPVNEYVRRSAADARETSGVRRSRHVRES